jgi:ribosomal protein L33
VLGTLELIASERKKTKKLSLRKYCIFFKNRF